MGAGFGHWITERNRRESERRVQVPDVTRGTFCVGCCPCSKTGFDSRARFHPDFKGIFDDLGRFTAHQFDGSIGSIWRT
jgi:hypothetical protein